MSPSAHHSGVPSLNAPSISSPCPPLPTHRSGGPSRTEVASLTRQWPRGQSGLVSWRPHAVGTSMGRNTGSSCAQHRPAPGSGLTLTTEKAAALSRRAERTSLRALACTRPEALGTTQPNRPEPQGPHRPLKPTPPASAALRKSRHPCPYHELEQETRVPENTRMETGTDQHR